ncbi:MAG: tetratricopeptide repeat protein [Gammaproteobacteria bacterium]|nr:tetratricopeptide repeat protein [Gammaproteobacteria bacterium]MDH3857765.1 tetratricopeptide repeat protein [Gammaproteobacteria bacterium]
MPRFRLCVIGLLLTGFGLTAVQADGGDDSGSSTLAPIKKLIKAEEYQQAISELDKALVDTPDSADLLNLLAYSNRKLGNFDTALDYYLKALKIEPDHRGANEYLGELYLQLGQPEKAEERLAVLDKECFFGCDEYDELKEAIEEYRKKNSP